MSPSPEGIGRPALRNAVALIVGAGIVVAAPLVMRGTSGPESRTGTDDPSIVPSILDPSPSPTRSSAYPRSVPGRPAESVLVAEGDAHGGHWRLYVILTLNEAGQLFECVGFERSETASEEEASSVCTTETRPPTQVAIGWVDGFVYGDAWTGFQQPLGRVVATLADGSTIEGKLNPANPQGMTRGTFVIALPSLDDAPARIDVFDASGNKFASGDAPSEPTPLATELAFPPAS